MTSAVVADASNSLRLAASPGLVEDRRRVRVEIGNLDAGRRTGRS